MSDVLWVGIGNRRFLGVPAASRARDSEGLAVWETYGAHRFAWTPTRCRNGRIRWLRILERHHDGSYTLGRLR